jgi:hypothetical protein
MKAVLGGEYRAHFNLIWLKQSAGPEALFRVGRSNNMGQTSAGRGAGGGGGTNRHQMYLEVLSGGVQYKEKQKK